MAVYIVTWNLNKEANYSQARDAFIRHLEAMDNTKDPGLESVRFVSTSSNANEVSVYLRQKMDADDKLLVSRMNRDEYYGWLSKAVWEWISARL